LNCTVAGDRDHLYCDAHRDNKYKRDKLKSLAELAVSQSSYKLRGAENAGVKKGVENAGAYRRGGKCRSGKFKSRSQGWKMQQQQQQQQRFSNLKTCLIHWNFSVFLH